MRPPGLCTEKDTSAQRMIGGRVGMRLTVLCELPAEHVGQHQSTFPDGAVWLWGAPQPVLDVDADGLTEIEASAKCQCGHRRDDHHRSWASCMEHVDAGRKWCACEEYRPAAVLTFIEPPEVTP